MTNKQIADKIEMRIRGRSFHSEICLILEDIIYGVAPHSKIGRKIRNILKIRAWMLNGSHGTAEELRKTMKFACRYGLHYKKYLKMPENQLFLNAEEIFYKYVKR